MGFLRDKLGFGGGDAGAVAQPANPLATKLGRLIGEDPGDVSNFASRLGTGMNMIAAGGGADPGYSGPAPAQPVNHLQKLDPRIMQMIMRNFQGGRF
jgi:hypothetical protein